MIILQWNARSLIANGQEFKGFINKCKTKPIIICIQETWLKPNLDFVIKGYDNVRRDRKEGNGGGCITLIKQGTQYRIVNIGTQLEYIVIEIWTRNGNIKVINFYNPGNRLLNMEELDTHLEGKVIWCGDFNAHSTLWGKSNDRNGAIIEELMETKNYVCLNDGSGTRINVRNGTESVIDLTLVSDSLAAFCSWQVIKDTTIGSDHYPIMTKLELNIEQHDTGNVQNWCFSNVDWEKFKLICDQEMEKIDLSVDVDALNFSVCNAVVEAANQAIKKKEGKRKKKIVPWWTKDCDKMIKDRNKAFKNLKKNHSFMNFMEYKKLQAKVRRTVKNAKKEYWRGFCNSVGRETKIQNVWSMIKRMNGIKKEYGYPILKDGEVIAIKDEEKANLLAKTFVKIHSLDNVSVDGQRGREKTFMENIELLQQVEDNDDLLNILFTKTELERILKKFKLSAPGKDQICYIMIKHFSDKAKEILLELYNRVWVGGKLPQCWKEAVVVPIRKPGKDTTNPRNYRPIALTSNVCKIMEGMINQRLMYYMERKGYISKYQSGFRRGRNTMDPVLCLEHEVRRAQINKESVVVVFFDIEKAYDTMWREGLLIKLRKIEINGRMFNWVKDFLMGRQIQVRIGKIFSEKFPVEYGTPQGSIVSPLLFSLMINDVFNGIKDGMGFSLFADDGAIWKRGKNIEFIVKKLQKAIGKVEEWSYKWGFKFSVEKTKTMFFTRKRVREELKLKLYGQELERVNKFKFLGLWFDERITWGVHIQSIIDKSKKVLNIMRCLVGREWGADRKSLKAIYNGLIRSVLDYGCVAYNSAAKTTLLKLNSIQNQAMRLCTGAFKTTPIAALQVETGEMPLEIRRQQIALNYWANLQGQRQDHPTQEILKPCWEKVKKATKSFGWIMTKKPVELKLDQFKICCRVPLPVIPPWILPEASVDLTLLDRKNKDKSFIINSHTIQNYIDNYYNYVQIYTDASKNTADHIGIAFIVPEFHIKVKKRINDKLSIYTGEMLAILLAIQWVEENRPLISIICSDSSSSLTSLQYQGGRGSLKSLKKS